MTKENLRVSIVIPAFEESENIAPVLRRIDEALDFEFECLVVVDSLSDSTIPFVQSFHSNKGNFIVKINEFGNGPAHAIRYGITHAKSKTLVVTMADGSDDPQCIPALVRLIERGISVACASRYMPGGQQVGANFLKSKLSRLAGSTLRILTRVGTSDATNSFKAYSRDFIEEFKIDSQFGFEMGLEMVAKAIRNKRLVAEVPTIWIERSVGNSNFELKKWLPKYLYWYWYALGFRKVTN